MEILGFSKHFLKRSSFVYLSRNTKVRLMAECPSETCPSRDLSSGRGASLLDLTSDVSELTFGPGRSPWGNCKSDFFAFASASSSSGLVPSFPVIHTGSISTVFPVFNAGFSFPVFKVLDFPFLPSFRYTWATEHFTANFPGTSSLSKPCALADDIQSVLKLIADASNAMSSTRQLASRPMSTGIETP